MPSTWPDLLEEGERLHAYLLTHYDELMGAERMEHFDIYYTSYATACEYEYISKRYGSYVKEAIRPWIEEEYKSGRLFERDNWKPFRDQCDYVEMYYGYRPLFIFHDILYFQLTLCDRVVDTPEGGLARYIVFEAALYGWKEEGKEALVPDGQVLVDNRMLERDWKIQ
jgi:hypothetical protein